MSIKIDFEVYTKYGKYSDALYLPDDHAYTEAQIADMQTDRVNAWIKVLETPVEESNG